MFTVKVSGQDGRKKAEEGKRNKNKWRFHFTFTKRKKKFKKYSRCQMAAAIFANAVSQKFVKAWAGNNVWQLCSCDSFTLWFTIELESHGLKGVHLRNEKCHGGRASEVGGDGWRVFFFVCFTWSRKNSNVGLCEKVCLLFQGFQFYNKNIITWMCEKQQLIQNTTDVWVARQQDISVFNLLNKKAFKHLLQKQKQQNVVAIKMLFHFSKERIFVVPLTEADHKTCWAKLIQAQTKNTLHRRGWDINLNNPL